MQFLMLRKLKHAFQVMLVLFSGNVHTERNMYICIYYWSSIQVFL